MAAYKNGNFLPGENPQYQSILMSSNNGAIRGCLNYYPGVEKPVLSGLLLQRLSLPVPQNGHADCTASVSVVG